MPTRLREVSSSQPETFTGWGEFLSGNHSVNLNAPASVRTNDVSGVDFRHVSGRKLARAVFQDGGADYVPRLGVRGSDQNQPGWRALGVRQFLA
jgi:hypothetical protein